jgi:hypothetical protein
MLGTPLLDCIFVVYLMLVARLYDMKWKDDFLIGNYLEGYLIEIICLNLSGGTEQNHDKSESV